MSKFLNNRIHKMKKLVLNIVLGLMRFACLKTWDSIKKLLQTLRFKKDVQSNSMINLIMKNLIVLLNLLKNLKNH